MTMPRRMNCLFMLLVLALPMLLITHDRTSQAQDSGNYQNDGNSENLPLPSSMPLNDYETILYQWLMQMEYKTLGWAVDKRVRDTGPFLNQDNYGVHPAVRIFYSPEVFEWLRNDRQGDIPDGAMIIKEMFTPPAAIYEEIESFAKYKDQPEAYEQLLGTLLTAWTVMIRDSQGSRDGWFWAGPGAPNQGESIDHAIERQLENFTHDRYSGFGQPCLRCHASADNEFTFSSLNNIQGESDEDPLRFRVDTAWRDKDYFAAYPLNVLLDDPEAVKLFEFPKELRPWQGDTEIEDNENLRTHMGVVKTDPIHDSAPPLDQPNPEFLAMFTGVQSVQEDTVKVFPSQWADHVVAGPNGAEQYITSDNCMACHGGLGGEPDGITMFIKTGPNYGDGYNVSEYGEWRWSPMGLAGRDPIFHAQLESEMAYLEQDANRTPSPLKGGLLETQQAVTNTCLSCHGAMGQRQLSLDATHNANLDPNFKVDYYYLTEQLSSKDPLPQDYEYLKYGELAREGISCTVCHHIDAPDPIDVQDWNPNHPDWITDQTKKELAYFLFHYNTGRYKTGPANELYGPFEDVAVYPMEETLDITPVYNEFTTNSQMCGTCHTINLPNIGADMDEFPVLTAAEQNPALAEYPHSIEQATFLEWQNSIFAQNPDAENSEFQSCQDCHMPGNFETLDGEIQIDQVVTQIASIQDTTYPQVEHQAPHEDITVPFRSDYKRHELVGLNVFLLKMFDQFPAILGVDKTDYMTSATSGNALALQNMIRQAQNDSVELAVTIDSVDNNELTATVTVTNKTGHRFPSGVAFRRAFLELLVMNGDDIIWGSGRTNSAGVIVDQNGNPLNTEFLPDQNTFQPHYQIITQQDQVQIYEELNQNMDREFTTSFVHRVHDIKDNRLLPKGWRASSFFKDQGEVMFQFMEATDPKNVGDDPDYHDQGPGFVGQDQIQYKIALPQGVSGENLTVKATMYYQAIPPYYLHQRFSTAPNGEATQRLFYLTSHLNLEDTPMENWKLKLVSAEVTP